MEHIETIQKLCGIGMTQLRKVKNNHGDTWYQVRCSGYDDGKKQVVTTYECNSLEIAKECFRKLTGVTI